MSQKQTSISFRAETDFINLLAPALYHLGLTQTEAVKIMACESIFASGDGDLIAKLENYFERDPAMERLYKSHKALYSHPKSDTHAQD